MGLKVHMVWMRRRTGLSAARCFYVWEDAVATAVRDNVNLTILSEGNREGGVHHDGGGPCAVVNAMRAEMTKAIANLILYGPLVFVVMFGCLFLKGIRIRSSIRACIKKERSRETGTNFQLYKSTQTKITIADGPTLREEKVLFPARYIHHLLLAPKRLKQGGRSSIRDFDIRWPMASVYETGTDRLYVLLMSVLHMCLPLSCENFW
jgi:hypothetical protein